MVPSDRGTDEQLILEEEKKEEENSEATEFMLSFVDASGYN